MIKILSGISLVLFCLSAFGAGGYEHGSGPLEVFDADGIAATPLWVKIWLGILVATFALGLVFVRRKPIARWATGGFVAGAVLGGFIFSALGLPFLGGSISIVHIVFWAPAFILLVTRRPFLDETEGTFYRVWSATMTSAMLFSFTFDFRDAYIYISHLIS